MITSCDYVTINFSIFSFRTLEILISGSVILEIISSNLGNSSPILHKTIFEIEMPLESGTTVSLSQLHEKLNLSQSSLPSSLAGLPSRLNFIGMVISYTEIRLVQWQKEVIFVITEGSIETLKISMWLNHENPLGLRFAEKEPLEGRLVYFKNVHITAFDYTDPTELQFYGTMNPPNPFMHTILVPVISGGACQKFIMQKEPFQVNTLVSLIPRSLQGKRSVCIYPLLTEDYVAVTKIIGLMVTFAECVVQKINFIQERNSFQQFINLQTHQTATMSLDNTKKQKIYRRCKQWLTSYYQYADWYQRCSKKTL